MKQHNEGANNIRPHKVNELKAVHDYLQHTIATATMAAIALNIYRPSLCRRKRTLEKAGLLAEIKEDYCKITGCKAAYLTTNPDLFPIHSSQLILF